jgi:hypothetical protein
MAVIGFTLIVLLYAKETGTTGGEIRHTEIRGDGVNDNNNANQHDEEEDDD